MNILRHFEFTVNYKNKFILMTPNFDGENENEFSNDNIFGDWRINN